MLFITEERLERVGGSTKVLIQEPNHLGKICPGEGLGHFLKHRLVSFFPLILTDTSIHVVAAKVQDAKAQGS